jgi:hypothetical protein
MRLEGNQAGGKRQTAHNDYRKFLVVLRSPGHGEDLLVGRDPLQHLANGHLAQGVHALLPGGGGQVSQLDRGRHHGLDALELHEQRLPLKRKSGVSGIYALFTLMVGVSGVDISITSGYSLTKRRYHLC